MRHTFVVALIFASSFMACAQNRRPNENDIKAAENMELLLNVYRVANTVYVDSVDSEKMVNGAIKSMLSQLDPYTEYIDKSGIAGFDFMTTGKYGGVGALIRQKGQWVEVQEPYKNTPSAAAGLKAGDRFLEVDGHDAKGIGSEKVSSLLKGDPGTDVTVKIAPVSDTNTVRTITMKREKIYVPAVSYYGLFDNGIGYISLDKFTDECDKDVKDALVKLKEQGATSIILDLRGNGGGVVGSAVNIAGLFLPKKTVIVDMKGRSPQGYRKYSTQDDPVDKDIPLAVMINSSSASASEILAGAFQDLDRAVIIGQRSYGKGLVQVTRQVADSALVKITVSKYYTPSGRCIQALDYTHRREDGSVEHVPDSLVKEFHTAAGRLVYDGGGINPDIVIPAEYMSKFSAILLAYGYLDDFANIYAAKHKAQPIETFKMTDAIYSQFVKFMSDKELVYKSAAEQKLEDLKKALENEEKLDTLAPELDKILSCVKENKEVGLMNNKEEVGELLAQEIIRRWWFAEGAIKYGLQDDEEIDKAMEILKNGEEYNRILKEQNTSRQ